MYSEKVKEILMGSILFLTLDRVIKLISTHVTNRENFTLKVELLSLFFILFIAIKISID